MSSVLYEGPFTYNGLGNTKSICNLKILSEFKATSVVILSELAENPGSSITNCYDYIATQVYHQFLLNTPTHKIIWVEHYNKDSYIGKQDKKESYDQVLLKWDEKKNSFSTPYWKYIGANWDAAIQKLQKI